MTHADEKFAREIGIDLSTCHDCREMDALHREHIERLRADLRSMKADLGSCAELEEELVYGSLIEKAEITEWARTWKLMAFAGWLLAGIFAAADLIGSGK